MPDRISKTGTCRVHFSKKRQSGFLKAVSRNPLDIEADPGNYSVLSWALEPGNAVAFHMLTLHNGAGTKALRRVFSVRMLGDDIQYAPRTWETFPGFPGFSAELSAGVPMGHKLLPLIWPSHLV